MVSLLHATKIAAPRRAVYEALTRIESMAGWHLGEVSGTISVGETLFLERRPGLCFGWRTDQLETDALIKQTPVEGPGASESKHLTIKISNLDDGRTLVELRDDGWREDDPHLPFCNSYWGEALANLRAYVERIAESEVTV